MKGKTSLISACVVYLILGLVLLFFPGLTAGLMCTAAGCLLLLYGVITVIGFFAHRGGTSYALQAELILGVVSAVVGIFLLTHSDFIISIIPIILGLYILIDGLVNLKRSFDLRALGYAPWTTPLVMSILSLVLAAFILTHPFGTGLTLWRIIGGSFVYQGVSDLLSIHALGKLTQD